MPTPIEILLDPVSLGILALYGALMLWEAIAPGRRLAKVQGWLPRALALGAPQLGHSQPAPRPSPGPP